MHMDAFNDISCESGDNERAVGARLYLDGFPPSVTVSELTDLLAGFGTVRSVEILTGVEGRPLSVAVVEMARAHEAEAVVHAINRTTLDGAHLFAFVADRNSPAGHSRESGTSF